MGHRAGSGAAAAPTAVATGDLPRCPPPGLRTGRRPPPAPVDPIKPLDNAVPLRRGGGAVKPQHRSRPVACGQHMVQRVQDNEGASKYEHPFAGAGTQVHQLADGVKLAAAAHSRNGTSGEHWRTTGRAAAAAATHQRIDDGGEGIEDGRDGHAARLGGALLKPRKRDRSGIRRPPAPLGSGRSRRSSTISDGREPPPAPTHVAEQRRWVSGQQLEQVNGKEGQKARAALGQLPKHAHHGAVKGALGGGQRQPEGDVRLGWQNGGEHRRRPPEDDGLELAVEAPCPTTGL